VGDFVPGDKSFYAYSLGRDNNFDPVWS